MTDDIERKVGEDAYLHLRGWFEKEELTDLMDGAIAGWCDDDQGRCNVWGLPSTRELQRSLGRLAAALAKLNPVEDEDDEFDDVAVKRLLRTVMPKSRLRSWIESEVLTSECFPDLASIDSEDWPELQDALLRSVRGLRIDRDLTQCSAAGPMDTSFNLTIVYGDGSQAKKAIRLVRDAWREQIDAARLALRNTR